MIQVFLFSCAYAPFAFSARLCNTRSRCGAPTIVIANGQHCFNSNTIFFQASHVAGKLNRVIALHWLQSAHFPWNRRSRRWLLMPLHSMHPNNENIVTNLMITHGFQAPIFIFCVERRAEKCHNPDVFDHANSNGQSCCSIFSLLARMEINLSIHKNDLSKKLSVCIVKPKNETDVHLAQIQSWVTRWFCNGNFAIATKTDSFGFAMNSCMFSCRFQIRWENKNSLSIGWEKIWTNFGNFFIRPTCMKNLYCLTWANVYELNS